MFARMPLGPWMRRDNAPASLAMLAAAGPTKIDKHEVGEGIMRQVPWPLVTGGEGTALPQNKIFNNVDW